MFRLIPSADDICNDAERYLRLEARRADRRGSLSAMTLAFDPPAPTASAPLEPRAALPPASPPPSTSAYSPSGEHAAPVAMLLGGSAAFSSSCTGPGLHPGHSEVETTPYPSALTTYAPPQHSAVPGGGRGARGGFDFALNACTGARIAPGRIRRDERV